MTEIFFDRSIEAYGETVANNAFGKATSITGWVILVLLACLFTPMVHAEAPRLLFSDLVSGPDSGLGDGLGQGVIVTLWGQNIGSERLDSSRVIVKDSSGVEREAAHVYYWKRADGQLPSGPADLFSSHKIQEVAFSIPESSTGPAEIVLEVEGVQSNPLPFTIRSGAIFHVMNRGSDSNGIGSFSDPWLTMDKADGEAPAGSTIYIHDVDTGKPGDARAIYWNNGDAASALDAQFATIAYPGQRPKVVAQRAVENFNTSGWVVSKLDVYASNYLSVDSNDQPTEYVGYGATYGIQTTKNGRVVGNRIGDIIGGCASGYQAAITGNARADEDRVSNVKIYGNEIYEYGCKGSSKLHHTTYLSVRSDSNLTVDPWEWGFNHLWGNKAKFGIHQYDQHTDCGDLSGPISIHDNVIRDQAGAGISIGSNCSWTMDAFIFNNILIRPGLAAAWDGLDVDTSDGPENGGIAIRDSKESGLTGTMFIYNNLIYKPTSDGQSIGVGGRGCLNLNGDGDSVKIQWDNNICVTTPEVPFVGTGFQAGNKLDNISGIANVWYAEEVSNSVQIPSWSANSIFENPGLAISDSFVRLKAESPAINSGVDKSINFDIYGRIRDSIVDIGPVEFSSLVSSPNPPASITIE